MCDMYISILNIVALRADEEYIHTLFEQSKLSKQKCWLARGPPCAYTPTHSVVSPFLIFLGGIALLG